MHASIVNAVRSLIEDCDGNTVVNRVYREANSCVDGLAKHGHNPP